MSENNENMNNAEMENSARADKIKAVREALKQAAGNGEVQDAASPEETSGEISDAQMTAPSIKSSGKKKKKRKKKKKTFPQRIRGLFPEKGDSVLEIIRKIVFLISIIAIIVCGYLVGDYYLDLWRNRMRNQEIARIDEIYKPIRYNDPDPEPPEEKYYELLTRARKLLDINPEIVGYLEIPTKGGEPIIQLPVMQTTNNEKYLDRSYDLTESRAGALFLDYRNHFDSVANHHLTDKNSDNLVVYGHNMGDDSMFGTLKYYHRIDDYYSKHPIIYFDSNYETYTYKIFSVMILDAEDETETKFDCWNRFDFNDEEEFYWFVNEAKRRTIRLNEVDVKYGDPLLTLSTCNTFLGDRGRLILMARRLRPGEDLYEGTQNSKRNPNIKWPTMYYNTVPNEKYDPDNFVPYGPVKKESSAPNDKKSES